MNKKSIKVDIFDTTLRDGQQCPGAGMSFENNLQYARLAADVEVDVLEAGFPSASSEDFKIVHSIAEMYAQRRDSPTVAALCQLREEQVVTTLKSIQSLIAKNRARLHVYVPVDPELMQVSLNDNFDKNKILKDLHQMVALAVQQGAEVEFSPEGYSRMADNFDFVTDLITAAVDAGASIINCPDTIGGACYLQGEDFFVNKMNLHANIIRNSFPDKKVQWSAHCHNDYGLALANTMASVFNGPVTQIEGCFNGIGERAGNVSLEQCIMYINAFGNSEILENRFYTEANTKNMKPISDFVASHMLRRQAHWPITGDNAAKHSSGGHTNAILKNPQAYQPFNPSLVGQKISFVFGPLSGSNHACSIIKDQGYICESHEKTQITQYIKDFYSTRRKGLTEEEFMKAYFSYRTPIKIDQYEYNKGKDCTHIKIKGEADSEVLEVEKKGKTALTALHKALEEHLAPIHVVSFRSQSKEKGKNACSISEIIISHRGYEFSGQGQDHDIEVSALKALVDAVNTALIDIRYSLKLNKKVI